MLVATFTNRHVWASPVLAALDRRLAADGFAMVDLPWASYAYAAGDPDHFTWQGLRLFCRDLALVLCGASGSWRPPRTAHIVTDSTVAYWDFDGSGAYTGQGSKLLERVLRRVGVHATVDAICGSGFVAGASTAETFPERMARRKAEVIVVIGGWNDVAAASRSEHDTARLWSAVAETTRHASHGLQPGERWEPGARWDGVALRPTARLRGGLRGGSNDTITFHRGSGTSAQQTTSN